MKKMNSFYSEPCHFSDNDYFKSHREGSWFLIHGGSRTIFVPEPYLFHIFVGFRTMFRNCFNYISLPELIKDNTKNKKVSYDGVFKILMDGGKFNQVLAWVSQKSQVS